VTAVHCCACAAEVEAVLVTGAEVYPHRPDLRAKQLWRCPTCGNSVGCHPGGVLPLGVIASPEIKNARQCIHALIDPIWATGRMPRKRIYAHLTEVLGRQFHTADLRTIEEARAVYKAARAMIGGLPE
jgi:hypothetical protein